MMVVLLLVALWFTSAVVVQNMGKNEGKKKRSCLQFLGSFKEASFLIWGGLRREGERKNVSQPALVLSLSGLRI